MNISYKKISLKHSDIIFSPDTSNQSYWTLKNENIKKVLKTRAKNKIKIQEQELSTLIYPLY